MGYEESTIDLDHIVVIIGIPIQNIARAPMPVVSTAEVECGCFEQLADAAQ
jgi:hypothetical protein